MTFDQSYGGEVVRLSDINVRMDLKKIVYKDVD
jgi:hypothetical protein